MQSKVLGCKLLVSLFTVCLFSLLCFLLTGSRNQVLLMTNISMLDHATFA